MPQGETGMKITIEHLTKQYGDFKAVDDLNLEIQDGELVGLLGLPAAENPPRCSCFRA